MAERILLVDGDILLYRFAYSNEFPIQWDEGVESVNVNLEDAKGEFDEFVAQSTKRSKCIAQVLCFSCPTRDNFRTKIYPLYKQHRTGLEKPVLYYKLKEHAFNTYKTLLKPGIEADDILGILATKAPNRYVIWSGDKDLNQIPGFHFRSSTNKIERVPHDVANRCFYIQTLTGDLVDNYKGCPGIGKVKAERVLETSITEFEMWQAVLEAYHNKGLTEEDALTQARVARILRASEYDFEKKEVLLWNPPAA